MEGNSYTKRLREFYNDFDIQHVTSSVEYP